MNERNQKPRWENIACVPVVKTLQEPAASKRAKPRRSAILQRALYLSLLSTIAASHVGVSMRHPITNQPLLSFPRLLAYISDQPEERAVLCLKSGMCERTCSFCDVKREIAGASEALNARERDTMKTLQRQWEAACLRCRSQNLRRRLMLEEVESSTG